MQDSEERITILLVDDEAPDRSSIRAILNGENYTVLEAQNYDEAVALHRESPDKIALLLVDLSLPGKNGLELASTLRESEPGLRMLFMSGSAGAALCKYYGLSVTDVHFLPKPVQADELLRRVRYVLAEAGHPFSGAAPA